MDTVREHQNAIVAFIAGIIVGGIGMWLLAPVLNERLDMKKEPEMEGEQKESAADNPVEVPILIQEGSRVDIDDQPAGEEVRITEVAFERAGWVAIHEEVNGELGNILGAALFLEGVSRGSVTLLRPTAAGASYRAVLYNDNGDRQFELGVDAQLVDPSQEIIEDRFQATAF